MVNAEGECEAITVENIVEDVLGECLDENEVGDMVDELELLIDSTERLIQNQSEERHKCESTISTLEVNLA